jgi:hypothetical protein
MLYRPARAEVTRRAGRCKTSSLKARQATLANVVIRQRHEIERALENQDPTALARVHKRGLESIVSKLSDSLVSKGRAKFNPFHFDSDQC